MPYGYVYLLRNTVNGKGYVGQTTQQPYVRFRQHARGQSRCRALKAAIAKHGASAFRLEMLGTAADRRELDLLEIASIVFYGTVAPNGYNLREGGAAGTHNEATRKLISAANKGKKQPSDVVERARQRMLGTSPSAEARQKISAALKGRPLPRETRTKMSLARMGRKHSDEARAKMSANRAGIPVSDECREKLRLANLGKRHSPETKAKMTAAHTARWALRRAPSCPV